MVDRQKTTPALGAARAVATSASGCAKCWNATGAMPTGKAVAVPRNSAAGSTVDTSLRTRGTRRQRLNTASVVGEGQLVVRSAIDVVERSRLEAGSGEPLEVGQIQDSREVGVHRREASSAGDAIQPINSSVK